MSDNLIPIIQPPFELGKHTAKLSVMDSEDAVIILRPRYEVDNKRMGEMIRGIDIWKKSNRVALRVLVVPHNFDVFALEVRDDGSGERGEVGKGIADAGCGDPGDETDHEDPERTAPTAAGASDSVGSEQGA